VDRHEAVSDIARRMWLHLGRPSGRDKPIWYAAEAEYDRQRLVESQLKSPEWLVDFWTPTWAGVGQWEKMFPNPK